MPAGNEIRNLLIKIKSQGGAKILADLDKMESIVVDGVNKGLTDTNKKLNVIGRTVKRRIKDLNELKKLTNSSGINAVGNANTLKLNKSMEHSLKNINENTINTNAALGQLNGTMMDMLDSMFQTTAFSEQAAEGIEQVGHEAKKTRKHLDGTTNSARKFGQEMKHTNKKGRGQAKDFAAMAGAGGALTTTYAALAANVFIVAQAFQALKTSSDLIRLEENISVLGDGRNLRGLAVELQEISGHALSVDTALRTAAQSAAYGFDSTSIKEMTKGAKQASIALGIDFNDALTRLSKGIAKQEVELLDELGIVTRLEPAMIKYANAQGKTVKELTDVERKLALKTEAMYQLDRAYGSINISSTEFEKIQAGLATITRQLGKEAASAVEPLLKLVNDAIKPYIESLNNASIVEGALSTADSAKGLVASATAYSEVTKAIEEQTKRQEDLKKKIEETSIVTRSFALAAKSLEDDNGLLNLYWVAPELRLMQEELVNTEANINKLTEAQKKLAGSTRGNTADSVNNLRALQQGYADTFQKISAFSASATKSTANYAMELSTLESVVKTVNAAWGEDTLEAHKQQRKIVDAINSAYKLRVATVGEFVKKLQQASDITSNNNLRIKLLDEENWRRENYLKIEDQIALKSTQISALKAAGLSKDAEALEVAKQLQEIDLKAAKRAAEKANYKSYELHQAELSALWGKAEGDRESELLQYRIDAQKNYMDAQRENMTFQERILAMRELELMMAEKEIALRKEATQIGGSAALTRGLGNANLAEVQANKNLGNDEAVWGNAVSGIESVWGTLQSMDTAMGNITGGFLNMGQIIAQSMQNGAFGAEAAAASIQAVSQLLQGISQLAVQDIDHQIAMEKKRDGQSKASQKKIAELEEKKRKEQQKTALMTAVMQTAAGITMALGSLPPPFSFVMAGITAAMGLAQVAAIRSQGKNAAALASVGSGANQSIEFGERMNNVDVAQGATAGERAFVTGQAGVGSSANDFVGASAGMRTSGSTAINVGERGAEVFIPEVPGTIVPSGDIKQGSGGGGIQIALQVDSMDAQSFMDRQEDLMDAIDEAIKAKYGKSLADM